MIVSVYINKQNEEALAECENKSGVINQALAQYFAKPDAKYTPDEQPIMDKVEATKYCKHEYPIGFCKHGCKK